MPTWRPGFVHPDLSVLICWMLGQAPTLQCPPFAPLTAVRQPCSMDPAMPTICSGICCMLLNISEGSFSWISKLVPSLPRLALLSPLFFFISSFSYFSPLLSRLQPLFRVRFLTDDITISVGFPAVLHRAVNCTCVAVLGSLFPSNPYQWALQ